MWFLRQVMPYAATYNAGVRFHLAGELDVDALAAAVREVVRRHESCRTTFEAVDGVVLQVIHESLPPDLSIHDVSLAPNPSAECNQIAVAAARSAFDPATGPLLRVRIVRVGRREFTFVFVVDHIVADGMSFSIFWREIEALYAAFRAGQPSQLHTAPRQFAECSEAQAEWMASEAFPKELAFWKERLKGAGPCDLPVDRPRPPTKSYVGGTASTTIPRELVARLEVTARSQRVSVFACILSALQVLLARYSGQSDVTVMVPVAARARYRADDVIGYLANLVVLRNDVSDERSFQQVLRTAGADLLQALAHQDVPFERVVGALRPERALGHDPLSSVGLSFLPAAGTRLELPGVASTFEELPSGGSRFDLQIFLADLGEEIRLWTEFSQDLFDRETIERFNEHLLVLLDAMTTNLKARVCDLPLMTEVERHKVLVTWNETTRPYPPVCLHDLVDAQVDRTPDAIAVIHGTERLTYRELDRRANRMGNLLQSLGVGPETLVGVCLERSIDMVVVLLGILKAGGAYVPLDPAYPRERLSAILTDSRAQVVVTDRRSRDLLPKHEAREVLLDEERSPSDRSSDERPRGGVGPGNLAYVLFTSGSTGRPKGVAIEHHSPVALVSWAREVYSLEDCRGTLFSTSICFDLSVFELFVPLSLGGKVILAQNALELPSLPARDEVTLVNTVPSAMSELIRAGAVPPSVRTVNLAGEPLPHALAQQIYAIPTIERLVNLYGPTEDTTYSTFAEGRRETGLAPPIGRPLSNGTAYVLDRHRNPVPIGVTGEVYLGGAGLARGYLHRPELTAERFVETAVAGRLYRTGDLARHLPDGTLEYQGRIDHQVKIRGFRIELGEIESVLREHVGVREVVVVAREDAPGVKRIVAYVAGDKLATESLRTRAREMLPDYMVPAAFVLMSALPLSQNGKVDRKALPAPERSERESAARVLPRNDAEARLAKVFRAALRLDAVGVSESFFDLGGDSLMAVRLVGEIEREFGTSLPLATLFRARTIEQLAVLVGNEPASAQPYTLVPIRTTGGKRPVFLVSRPNVNSLGYIALSRHLDSERPLYSLQYEYPEEEQLGRPYTADEYGKWASTYLEAIRRVQPHGPYLLGGMCEGAQIAFTMTRQLEDAGESVALLTMFDAWPVDHPVRPLMMRARRYEMAFRKLGELPLRELLSKLATKTRERVRLLSPRRTENGSGSDSPGSVWSAPTRPGDLLPLRVRADILVLSVQRQPYWRTRDANLGWGHRTSGTVEVHVLSGEHTTLLRDPHVVGVAQHLEQALRRTDFGMSR